VELASGPAGYGVRSRGARAHADGGERSGFEKRPEPDAAYARAHSTTEQKECEMATKATTTRSGNSAGWTDDERAAMKEHAAEIKRAGGKAADKAAAEAQACLDKIAEMPEADRVLAERIHAIVTETAPELAVRTYYGMPAYAKDGKVLCWFKAAAKFKTRYATMGFSDLAALDDGNVWPTEFAVTALTKADETRIADLVKKALG
jgi:uncharacterized protein YdhG (YjbR/CyaY superfamily)